MKGTIVIEVQNNGDNPQRFAERIEKYEKIFRILIEKGGLDGVRRGKTIIHWDDYGNFKSVSLDYSVWVERS